MSLQSEMYGTPTLTKPVKLGPGHLQEDRAMDSDHDC